MRAKFYDCFCTNTFYFIWLNFLSVGIVDIFFQSAGTGKCATPTRHLSIHFEPFAVSYELFPRPVKSKTIGFLLDRTQQYTPVLVAKTPRELLPEKELLSGHYAAYSAVAGTCYIQRARDFTMCALKVAESAWQNDFYCYGRTSHITLSSRKVSTRLSVVVGTSTSVSRSSVPWRSRCINAFQGPALFT